MGGWGNEESFSIYYSALWLNAQYFYMQVPTIEEKQNTIFTTQTIISAALKHSSYHRTKKLYPALHKSARFGNLFLKRIIVLKRQKNEGIDTQNYFEPHPPSVSM